MLKHMTCVVLFLGLMIHSFAAWPTLHKDSVRSGYTDEMVPGPYERKWFRNFAEEMISTRTEAIIADGLVYIGTLDGNVYALSVSDGTTVWSFKTAGPVGHSPLYMNGRLYVGCDAAFNRGIVYCLDARDGSLLWETDTRGGVFTSPAGDGEQVYLGDRTGTFYALSALDGDIQWTYETGYMILQPASVSSDGLVIFGSEDMHVYALERDGKLRWRSKKLGGLSLRDHAPTIWQGMVIVRSNPAESFHSSFGQDSHPWKAFHQSLPMQKEDEVTFDKWGKYAMKYTSRRFQAEQEWVRSYLSTNRHEQTFYALDLKNGKERWLAPIVYTATGLHSVPPAPAFHPETGELYILNGTVLSSTGMGVPGLGSAVMTLDPDSGLTEMVPVPSDDRYPNQPSDETHTLSLMGDRLLCTHQGSVLGLNLKTKERKDVYNARDSYGGIIGQRYYRTEPPARSFYTGFYSAHRKGQLAGMANEWHGPDCSIVSVAEGRIFWVAGSQVVCISGPELPATPSGGTEYPGPLMRSEPPGVPAGNVAVAFTGDFDPQTEKTAITEQSLQAVIEQTPARQHEEMKEKDIQRRLEQEVATLIDQWPWAPFIQELGISGEDIQFWRAEETIQTTALALPWLSPRLRRQAVELLDRLFAEGYPLQRNIFPLHEGKRREMYTIGPDMDGGYLAAGLMRNDSSLPSLYAVWAYAYFADRWQQVSQQMKKMDAVLAEFLAEEYSFAHPGYTLNENGDFSWKEISPQTEQLNADINGLLGYLRIAEHVDAGAHRKAAKARLKELVELRMYHEKADDNLVRKYYYGAHSAAVPRYNRLTPELCQWLYQFQARDLAAHVRTVVAELPVWYQAFAERMIGGENYTNPAHFPAGVFMVMSDGLRPSPDVLRGFLDQPWCEADLYYINKLSSILRVSHE